MMKPIISGYLEKHVKNCILNKYGKRDLELDIFKLERKTTQYLLKILSSRNKKDRPQIKEIKYCHSR